VVEAVSATGMYEWAYSCALDAYLHTSWMSSVSGGPAVMSLCHGLFSGLCAVSNLARLHQEGRCVDARVRAEGAAVATVGADWDLVSSSCRPPTVLSLHPHFTAQGAKGEGEVDAEPDAGVLEAPEWGEQEEEEGVEAEARGGGEGSLWGKPPHLHTHMVTSETPKLEYAQHAFDIRRSRPLQSGPLAQPLPLPAHEVGDGLAGGGGGGRRVHTGIGLNKGKRIRGDGGLSRMQQLPCVRRTDGGKEGWCVWGWRVEQTLPLHFENVIEELWVGAVGSKGGMAGGHLRWLLLPLSRDAEEYAIEVPCNGSLVDLSQLARGWTGFFLKVVLSGSGARYDRQQQQPHHSPATGLAAASSAGASEADRMVISFTPEHFPRLFGGSDSSVGGQIRVMDLQVKMRLKARFAKASVPLQDAPTDSTAAAPSTEPGNKAGAMQTGQGGQGGHAAPDPQTLLHRNVYLESRPAAGAGVLQEQWQSMLRAASEAGGLGLWNTSSSLKLLDQWSPSRLVAWLRLLAEICEAGGAVVVSSVLQGNKESGMALVLSLLACPGNGAAWGEIERGCLHVLAILMEPRSGYHLPALQGPAAARGSGRGTGSAVGGHPFVEALLGNDLASLLAGREAAGLDEGLRVLVKTVVGRMRAQQESALLQKPACRLLAALATLRLPHAEATGARSTALACRLLQEEGGIEALATALVTHRASCERVAMYALDGVLVLARRKQMRGEVLQHVRPALMLEVIARYGMASSASNKAAWLLCESFAPRSSQRSNTPAHNQLHHARGHRLDEEVVEDEGDLSLFPSFDVVLQALLWALQLPELRSQRPLALMGLRHLTLGSLTPSTATANMAQRAEALGVSLSAAGRVTMQGKMEAQHLNKAQHRMRGFVQLGGLEAVLQASRDADEDADADACACAPAPGGSAQVQVDPVSFERGAVEEEICALLSALLVSNVVDPSRVASLGAGEAVVRILKWTERCADNLGILRQAVCLLANLVSANALPDSGGGSEGATRPGQDQVADRQLANLAERVVQYGAIGAVVRAQERWMADAVLTGQVLRFLTAVAAVPAPCNAAFSGPAKSPAPGYSSTSSLNAKSKTLARKQVANYVLSDDIRLTGIHDSILIAVRRYHHPLMHQVSTLHSLLAHPAWGQSKVLAKDSKIKTKRVLGYRSSAAATYAAASALTSFADNPAFPRTASVPKQLRHVPLATCLENSLLVTTA
jgi:hypothetical protein